jgi:hypothetical protein
MRFRTTGGSESDLLRFGTAQGLLDTIGLR